jgi:hypothetical protein
MGNDFTIEGNITGKNLTNFSMKNATVYGSLKFEKVDIIHFNNVKIKSDVASSFHDIDSFYFLSGKIDCSDFHLYGRKFLFHGTSFSFENKTECISVVQNTIVEMIHCSVRFSSPILLKGLGTVFCHFLSNQFTSEKNTPVDFFNVTGNSKITLIQNIFRNSNENSYIVKGVRGCALAYTQNSIFGGNKISKDVDLLAYKTDFELGE